MHLCQIIILEKGAVNTLHQKDLEAGYAGTLLVGLLEKKKI
jgi:hypothetical protein